MLCSSETLNAHLKFFIAKSRLLFIDEKEIRDVVLLKFLNLLQKCLKFNFHFQKLFDLAFETNFNKISYDDD